MPSSQNVSFGYRRFSSSDTSLTRMEFWSTRLNRGSHAVGGSEISLKYHKFYGIGRVLPEVHMGFFQDCSTSHLSDEEGGGFPVGP